MVYVFQKGERAGTETGNGGILWAPPFGTNAAYKEAIAPYDIESNNKWDDKLGAYKMKTPCPMYLQKVYDALISVPRDPDVIVDVDQASLDSLMTLLRAIETTIDLNAVNENTTAIVTGSVTFTMKHFIKDLGFKWDPTNKHYAKDIDEEGALQELSNELKDMCTEWGIQYTDHTTSS
jgi:hypothetical protein